MARTMVQAMVRKVHSIGIEPRPRRSRLDGQ